MILLTAVLISLSLTSPALAFPCLRLKTAITIYDVSATIQDEDVKKWNAIIQASRQLKCRAHS